MATYAVVETALARMHGADPAAQRGAFRGRLKHFQRLGLPLEAQVGKGRRVDYTPAQIWQFALALELAQCGIDPTTIVRLIVENWATHLEGHLIEVTVAPRREGDKMMVLNVGFMSLAWEDQDQTLAGIKFLSWSKPIFPQHATQTGDKRRAITINISDMMRELSKELATLQEE